MPPGLNFGSLVWSRQNTGHIPVPDLSPFSPQSLLSQGEYRDARVLSDQESDSHILGIAKVPHYGNLKRCHSKFLPCARSKAVATEWRGGKKCRKIRKAATESIKNCTLRAFEVITPSTGVSARICSTLWKGQVDFSPPFPMIQSLGRASSVRKPTAHANEVFFS